MYTSGRGNNQVITAMIFLMTPNSREKKGALSIQRYSFLNDGWRTAGHPLPNRGRLTYPTQSWR